MTIKMQGLLETYRKMADMSMEQAFSERDEVIDFQDEMGEYLNRVSDKAQQIILESTDEKDFVQAFNAIMSSVVSYMLIQGGRTSQLKFMLSGDMQSFVHTVTLSIIGMLIDEEIL